MSMSTLYRILALAVCALVATQAAMHAWGTAGMARWIDQGGVLDKATGEAVAAGSRPFPEMTGIIVHGMNGMFVIPLVALCLLVVGLVSRLPRAAAAGGAVLGLVVLQVSLGLLGYTHPLFGLLHGINALVLFTTALYAARLGRRAPAAAASVTADTRVDA